MLTTPVDRIRCSLVGELRVPARASSLSVQPSPLSWRVGVHITTFEACSSFTRVTACRVAHPPSVGFIARLRPGRFPGSDARKPPSSTNNLLGWVLPPLVIYAVEAHTITPCISPDRETLGTGLQQRRRNPWIITTNCSAQPSSASLPAIRVGRRSPPELIGSTSPKSVVSFTFLVSSGPPTFQSLSVSRSLPLRSRVQPS